MREIVHDSEERRVDWATIWLNLLAAATCVYALLVAASASLASKFTVLAPPQGQREWFIEDQQAAVAVWALSTAVAVVVLRFGPQLAPLAVGVWGVVLVRAAPWGWPNSPPVGSRYEATIWRDHWFSLGVLLLMSVVFGCTVGWRGNNWARYFAATVAGSVGLLLAVSAFLVLSAQAEEQSFSNGFGHLTPGPLPIANSAV